jgi:NADH-quinone oxidoreductase subunit L
VELAHIIVFLPLLAAIVVGASFQRVSDLPAQLITTGALMISAICSFIQFGLIAVNGGEPTHITLLNWISSGDFKVSWSLLVDPLTAVMMVVVTSVSALVHLYSIGYMSHDPAKPRFMAYLSLFTFFMLMLVSADNLVQLFLGWEGVGLCSYLLIGFWYHKPEANAAAMKAFIVNRVGDFGFALGIFAIFLLFGSVQFDEIFAKVPGFAEQHFIFLGAEFHAMTVICLLLFMGACGKSAQLGLHTWLPDAMEGPTPVSALIHAATMVTAGVFLVARCSPLFEYAPDALMVVTVVGACTAFFAATVGLVQNDIKRVIAYSTCSQLGYMFFACGVSAYSAGIFHLMTHGFFKALLFLGAGSVIHAMSDEQDLRKMGGIAKKIPFTFIFMWIGSLALAGIPPFAGYFSKDVILEAAYAKGGNYGMFAYGMGICAALMTAFYSWRLLFLAFYGKPRADADTMNHVHESPVVMLVPLLILSIGAIFSGWIGSMLGMVDASGEFWQGSIVVLEANNVLKHIHHIPAWVPYSPLVAGIAGISLAWLFYIRNTELPKMLAQKFSFVHRFLLNKWYFDELYQIVFVNNALRLGQWFYSGDKHIVDRFGPDGMAWMSLFFARKTGQSQTGYLYHYAFAMLLGVLILLSWFMYTHLWQFLGGAHG